MTSRHSPYPGLRPYNEDERERFFGREAEVSVLIDKILAHRLTLLFAATGVGKSSLLKAAVIPQLKSPHGHNLSVIYYSDWVSHPIDGLQNEIKQTLEASGAWSANMAQRVDVSSGLTDFLELCTLFIHHPLIIVLDQFEEFFRYRKRYHQKSFRPFINQLTELITSPHIPVSLVFSMREDFALELNAFKPKLSNLLFDNYFRLERLTAKAARSAVATPAKQVGFHYEPELLDQIITDLLSRDLDHTTANQEPSYTSMTGFLNQEAEQPSNNLSFDEELETVEPPYLQIVCSQLWEQEKNSPDKTLHLATYDKAGRAKGLLKNYLQEMFKDFTQREKQIASKAFDHLISHRGTKMAHTPPDLAKLTRTHEKELGKLLEKLSQQRVLRSQHRAEQIWYELYHDMFSDSIDEWNTAWKSRRRKQNAIRGSGLFILLASITSFGTIAYVNHTTHHFRLGTTEDSRIQVYRGKNGWPDPFGQQGFEYELEISRSDLESDKQFKVQAILNYADLYNELIGYQPLEKRVVNYIDKGDFVRAMDLTQQVLASNNQVLSKKAVRGLFHLKTQQAFDFLREMALKERQGFRARQHDELQQTVKTFFRENTLSLPIDDLAEFNFFYDDFRRLKSYHFEQNIWAIEDPRLLQIVIELLQNENQNVQRAAIQVLGQSSETSVVPQLVEHLQSKNSDIRKFASQALGRIGDPSTTSAITALLNDEDLGVRENSTLALGYIGDPASIPQLKAQLRDTTPAVRYAAVDALGRIGKPDPLPDIAQRLQDEDEDVRKAVVRAFGRIGDTTAIPGLRMALQDKKPQVRNEAIRVLGGQFTSQDTVQELVKKLQSADELVRREAASTLEQVSSFDTVAPLIQTLDGEDAYVRQYAIQALGNIGSFESLQALARALKDSQIESKYYAAQSLGKIGINTFFSLASLLQCVDSQSLSSPAQHKCIDALGENADAFVVSRLRPYLYSDNTVVRGRVSHALWKIGIPYHIEFNQYGRPAPLRWSDFFFERLNKVNGIHQDKKSLLVLLNQAPSKERNQQLLELVKRGDVHFSIQSKALMALAETAEAELIDFLKTFDPPPRLQNTTTQMLERLKRHTSISSPTASSDPQLTLNTLQHFKTSTDNESAIRQWFLRIIDDNENPFSSHIYRLMGDLQSTSAIPVLKKRLQALETNVSTKALAVTNKENSSQGHKAFDYGYALSRLDPDEGIRLLTHPLTGVRQGAYTGFAMQADTEWLQTLDEARRNLYQDNPVFQYAAFRAIDLGLHRLAIFGKPEDMNKLHEWQANLNNQSGLPQEDEVLQRLKWTTQIMEHYQKLTVELERDYGLKRVWPDQNSFGRASKPPSDS